MPPRNKVFRQSLALCLLGMLVTLWPGILWAAPEEAAPAEISTPAPQAEPAEPSSADRLSVRQQQVADNFQHLQELLLRMAELSEMTDPRRATLLRKAVHESEERLLAVQFESLVDLLEKDRLSPAIENQDDLQQDLRALLELLLSENRARRIDSEKARVREYLKRLNQIIKQQKGIQGRTAGSGPPGPLADRQRKLADNTGDLADDIQQNEEPAGGSADKPSEEGQQDKRPQEGKNRSEGEQNEGKPEGQPEGKAKGQEGGRAEGQGEEGGEEQKPDGGGKQGEGPNPGHGEQESPSPPQAPKQDQNPARPRIESAENRMREAHKKLEEAQREGAVKEQEEAIRELEQAKAELEEILRQLREEEIERTLTLLEARLEKMLGMQREVNEGTLRLDKIPQPERTHSHEIEASRLGREEAQIVLEADKALALLRDDGTAVAVPEALDQVRQDMREVVRRLDRTEVGPITQTIEEEIVAALEEMIEVFQQAQQEAEKKRKMPMPPGPPQDQALVDLLAEIKMVRAMQMRVNRRTDRYAKLIDGEQAENADLLEALDRLAERQERIHQITRDLDRERRR
ncbi:MAG: hypothetical protein ABIP48_13760 [Planctomycetota bacterium]